jgi:hypothetical protein
MLRIIGAPGEGAAELQLPSQSEIKKTTDFVGTVISKVFRDLLFSLNQPLESLMSSALEYRNI